MRLGEFRCDRLAGIRLDYRSIGHIRAPCIGLAFARKHSDIFELGVFDREAVDMAYIAGRSVRDEAWIPDRHEAGVERGGCDAIEHRRRKDRLTLRTYGKIMRVDITGVEGRLRNKYDIVRTIDDRAPEQIAEAPDRIERRNPQSGRIGPKPHAPVEADGAQTEISLRIGADRN